MIYVIMAILILLFLRLPGIEGIIRSGQCTHVASQDDQVFNENFIKSFHDMRSIHECSMKCGHTNGCKGFAYHKSGQMCNLFDAAVQTKGSDAPGWRYFSFAYEKCPNSSEFFYDSITETCYFFTPVMYTFEQARRNCKLMKGRLAVFDTHMKIGAFKSYNVDEKITENMLIGLRYIMGDFKWVNGASLSVSDWDAACPSSDPGKDCVVMKTLRDYKWHSVSCDKPLYSLCELI